MKSVLVTIAVLCAHFGPVNAQETTRVPDAYTAERMMQLCEGTVSDRDADMQSMVCTFRLQGVGDLMSLNCMSRMRGFETAPELSAAITGSRGAVRQVFINYMQDHPELWRQYWATVVALALSDTFPCDG